MSEIPTNGQVALPNEESNGDLTVSLSPELLESLRLLQETLRPHLPQIRAFAMMVGSAVARLTEAATAIVEKVAKAIEPFIAPLIQIGITSANCEKLERAGWLPHYTSPLDMLENGLPTIDEINSAFHEHYAAKWPSVRTAFEERLARYSVDAEAKKTFEDALRLHELGMYKAVSRLVFPEIERLARNLRVDGRRRDANVQSLREAAGQLTLSQIEPCGLYGLALFRTLDGSAYEWADGARELERRGIPNRHAVMHSFHSFDTLQCSVNALILTDYVMQVVHAHVSDAAMDNVLPTKWLADNLDFPPFAASNNETV